MNASWNGPALVLVSHHLCPYVQRAVVSLLEKQVPFERVYVDLANKPAWLLDISPRGLVPVLRVGEESLFESLAICEYLEDTIAPALHPTDPLVRARHRAWLELGSAFLNDIWVLETATERPPFLAARERLQKHVHRLENALGVGPYFDGARFSLVDAVFAPAFRYFEVFDGIADTGVFSGAPKVERWRAALSVRPSVRAAVSEDYGVRLEHFLLEQRAYLLQYGNAA